MKSSIVATALLLLALSSTSCSLSSQHTNPSSQSSEHLMSIVDEKDFLLTMIPHHQEAIDASEYLLQRNPSPMLKTFLQKIIDDQSREIGTMKSWLKSWYGITQLPENRYVPMMPVLEKLSDQDASLAYIDAMIVHHESAVAMAKKARSFTERPQLPQFAKQIITGQKAEIRELQLMQKRLSHTGSLMR